MRARRFGEGRGVTTAPLRRISVVMLALVCEAVAVGHMGFVRHELCAHGELVEPTRAHVASADDRCDRESVVAADPAGHEHCAALALTRSTRALPAVAFGVTLTEQPAVAADAARSVTKTWGLAILDVAPKHGPPAAA